MSRDEILEDEFVRAKLPGLREFSVGVLKLARKLAVGLALPNGELPADEATAARAERDLVILTWLLDERHSLDEIKRAADAGRAALEPVIDDYEFAIPPALVNAAKLAIARTNAALEQVMFKVVPKPGSAAPDAPPGNS